MKTSLYPSACTIDDALWRPTPTSNLARFLQCLVAAVLWASFINFPTQLPNVDRDNSWSQAMAHFLKHRFQAGHDYYFSYGPLGYFASSVYDPDLYWWKLAWELVVKLLFVIVIFRFTTALGNHWVRYAALFLLAVVGRQIATMPDVIYLFLILATCILLLNDGAKASRGFRLFGTCLIAILSLTKFTLLTYACLGIAVVTTHWLWRGYRRPALEVVGSFAAAFLLVWCVFGQNPLHLPEYLYGSMQIASGYTEAMSLEGSWVEGFLAAVVFACISGALIGQLLRLPISPRSVAIVPLVGFALVLMWKNGFIRHDHHSFGFFALGFLVCYLPHGLFAYSRSIRPLQVTPLLIAGLVSFAAMQTVLMHQDLRGSYNPLELAAAAVKHDESVVETILHPFLEKERLEASRAQVAASHELPQIKQTVGDSSVDIISHQQGLLLLNGMNWRPRPSFQSYFAYTPYLAGANAWFFRGPDAPRFVVLRFEAVDNRLPMLEDGEVLLEICRHYRPVLAEKGYVLVERGPVAPLASVAETKRRDIRVRLDEVLQLDDENVPTIATIDIRLTKRGSLMKAFFKLPPLHLLVRTEEGHVDKYRFVPAMGRSQFLLSPLVKTNHDFVQLYGGAPGRKVAAFWLSQDPDDAGCYHNRATVSLTSVSNLVHSDVAKGDLNRALYPGFKDYPDSMQSDSRVGMDWHGGADVLIVHPQGEIKYSMPRAARRLHGRFGIMPVGYEVGNTDGVLFRVEFAPVEGETQTLFERYLNPCKVSADRGMQTLDVNLPSLGAGALRLRTIRPPGTTDNWDWSYWSGIALN